MHFTPMFLKDQVYIYLVFALSCYLICYSSYCFSIFNSFFFLYLFPSILTFYAESRTRLSDFTFTFHFHAIEKEMATHSSVLAWRIPGTGEPVGCRLWGRAESDTTEST